MSIKSLLEHPSQAFQNSEELNLCVVVSPFVHSPEKAQWFERLEKCFDEVKLFSSLPPEDELVGIPPNTRSRFLIIFEDCGREVLASETGFTLFHRYTHNFEITGKKQSHPNEVTRIFVSFLSNRFL